MASKLFTVIGKHQDYPASARNRFFLVEDNWDDWFSYSTLYSLCYLDSHGYSLYLGGVKIGQFGMGMGHQVGLPDEQGSIRSPKVGKEFDSLNENFFSVGQDASYYQQLNDFPEIKSKVLVGLRDIAYDPEIFERAYDEPVMGRSLLRSVTRSSVEGQFRRIAGGGARLTSYAFEYFSPPPKTGGSVVSLAFDVQPNSQPPTNVHVLIGRNGVGKTRILNAMTRALVEEGAPESEVGHFSDTNFANIVSVTFSAFDPFEPLPVKQNRLATVQYCYIGLKHTNPGADGKPLPPKTPNALGRDFSASIKICRQGARAERWRKALQMLEADPIFQDAKVASLADIEDDEELKESASNLFRLFSSGHKIVLLTITRLVETVEEKTLVLLDEPEAHLHPPLLSAFVRALSELLVNRNGVAIVATHSPVILQEVPKKCVWKVRRSGAFVAAERPRYETFGENVGVLTHETFGLEVTHSGFHKIIQEKVKEIGDYQQILEHFNGELGAEARSIIRALLVAKESS